MASYMSSRWCPKYSCCIDERQKGAKRRHEIKDEMDQYIDTFFQGKELLYSFTKASVGGCAIVIYVRIYG